MQNAFALRGVIFDMDGVLCDSEPLIAEAAGQMFREKYGAPATAADFHPFIGTGEDRFLGGVAEKYGVRLQPGVDKDRTYEIYLQLIPGRLQPLPGAHDFVAAARAHGLKLALATSADRIKLQGNLTAIQLPESNFDAAVTGGDVRRKKPHPDIFLLAAERIGVAPAKCLVVEDAPSGLQAGQAAGCRCLGITSTFGANELRAAGADWIAPDLARALGLLAELTGG
jgi:HAD superfamily hydrolase (TIGR01509 family)